MSQSPIALHALVDVEPVGTEAGCTTWRFLGPKPSFGFDGLELLARGSYRVTIEPPDGWGELSEPKLYVDSGEGSESERVDATLRGDIVSFAFRLPDGADRLRFEPNTLAATMTVKSVTISRISGASYWLARWGAVVRHRFRDVEQTKRTLSSVAAALRHGGPRRLAAKVLEKAAEGDPHDTTFTHLPFSTFQEFADRQGNYFLNELDSGSGAYAEAACLLSVIVPIADTDTRWLPALLRSLDRQSTQSFEVVAVCDEAHEAALDILHGHDSPGWSLQRVTLPATGSNASAANAGMEAASGLYVTIVDPKDVLSQDFVRGFHAALAARESDIYFADEAIVDHELNTVLAVHTRGAFDLRFYLCHPYVVHPVFYRTSLIRDAELTRREPEGGESETDDLLLQCLTKAGSVTHIPVVAYYRRSAAASAGQRAAGVSLADARARVRGFLSEFFGWDDVDIEVVAPDVVSARVRGLPRSKAAIVVPTKNGLDYLVACIDSVRRNAEFNRTQFDIFVIDHESDDERLLEYLRSSAATSAFATLRYEGPWNFSAINNWAVNRITERDDYSHLVFMNNDIEVVTPDWLDRMIELFAFPDVGVVGCCLIYPDEIVQHAGMVVGMSASADHSHRFHPFRIEGSMQRAPGHMGSLLVTRDYGAVTAALMAVPTELFLRVGGFDEQLAVMYNDADLCLRIRDLGYATTYNGQVVAIHHESASRGKEPQPVDAKLFCERHRDIVHTGDPSYGHLMDWNSSRIRYSFQFPDKAAMTTTLLDKYRGR